MGLGLLELLKDDLTDHGMPLHEAISISESLSFYADYWVAQGKPMPEERPVEIYDWYLIHLDIYGHLPKCPFKWCKWNAAFAQIVDIENKIRKCYRSGRKPKFGDEQWKWDHFKGICTHRRYYLECRRSPDPACP